VENIRGVDSKGVLDRRKETAVSSLCDEVGDIVHTFVRCAPTSSWRIETVPEKGKVEFFALLGCYAA
jgi:hypothetical protein